MEVRHMATLEHESAGSLAASPAIQRPRLRWTRILSISIFWLALSFHWAALGIIILPSQVFKIAGNADKGVALAFVLVPGAFVSLFANPLFGMLSDRTHGRLAAWGRRRPYILIGTLVNIAALALMLITIVSVREKKYPAAQGEAQDAAPFAQNPWFKRIRPYQLRNVFGTLMVAGAAWGIVQLWNGQLPGLHITANVQQVMLELIATVGLLRLFDFNPRRDPDFAWVLLTRLVMMLGIYTIQAYFQYYMRDAVGVPDPERQTTNFVIIISLTSLVSALAVGWLSDRFGRKRMVYFSGGFMALVGLTFITTHSLVIVLAAGAIF